MVSLWLNHGLIFLYLFWSVTCCFYRIIRPYWRCCLYKNTAPLWCLPTMSFSIVLFLHQVTLCSLHSIRNLIIYVQYFWSHNLKTHYHFVSDQYCCYMCFVNIHCLICFGHSLNFRSYQSRKVYT